MTNSDPEADSHKNNEFFFLLTIKLTLVCAEVPEYAEMQYYLMTSLRHNNDITL